VGHSNFGGAATDFVVGHFSGTPTTMYPAVLRYASAAGSQARVCAADASGRNGAGYDAQWNYQVLDLVHVYEGAFQAGLAYHLTLRRVSGDADIAFAVYDGTPGGVYAPWNASAYSTALTEDFDTLTFVAQATGWHPVVVYRPNGLPPVGSVTYNFGWSTQGFVGVQEEAGPGELALLAPLPNPTAGRMHLGIVLPRMCHVRLVLYGVDGRRVRTLADRDFPVGRHVAEWDGRDDLGSPVAPGLYWARLEVEGRALTRRVVVVR
jgi:hypothetical protein